jgi:predicted alpha/beta hydrolase family esterase
MYTYRPAHWSGRPKRNEKMAGGLIIASPDCKLVEQWRENMRAHKNMESTTT